MSITPTQSPSLESSRKEPARTMGLGKFIEAEHGRESFEAFCPTGVESSLLVHTRGASAIIAPRSCAFTTQLRFLATPAELSATIEEIRRLRRLSSGWNGYDVKAPDFGAVENAVTWIKDMYEDALKTGKGWRKPHVTADENGDVTFEWWNGGKGLTVYVSEQEASYITDYGSAIVHEMEDGPASTSEERQGLWLWLMG